MKNKIVIGFTIILILLIIILIIFLIPILHKHIILEKISNSLNKNNSYQNYYIKGEFYNITEDKKIELTSITEHYQDGKDSVSKRQIIGSQSLKTYKVNGNINIYTELPDGKKYCYLDNDHGISDGIELDNYFLEDILKLNKINYFKFLKDLEIKEENDCYIINIDYKKAQLLEYFNDMYFGNKKIDLEKVIVKIEIYKDTGLIKQIEKYYNGKLEDKSTYIYEFNKVKKEDFVEPDDSEYEHQYPNSN